MQIIVVGPDDRGTQAGTLLPAPPAFRPTPIRERINEPIDPAGSCRVFEGKPYIFFGDWDYAEDWSGEFVREVHPSMLIGVPRISVSDFWKMVSSTQAERARGNG